MSSPPPSTSAHRPAHSASRRGRPPGPQRRPGACLTSGQRQALGADGWDNLSGRAQILLAAASQLDRQIQERITLERMCRWLELDAHNLTAAFKQFHGCSMSTYLQQFRTRCLFQAMTAEPQTSLLSLFRRYGLGPTPSERRSFRSQFGLSIEAHQQRCLGESPRTDLGPEAPPRLSALAEAFSRLAVEDGAVEDGAVDHGAVDHGAAPELAPQAAAAPPRPHSPSQRTAQRHRCEQAAEDGLDSSQGWSPLSPQPSHSSQG
jgi:AraC-like DNA-binding protein